MEEAQAVKVQSAWVHLQTNQQRDLVSVVEVAVAEAVALQVVFVVALPPALVAVAAAVQVQEKGSVGSVVRYPYDK